MGVRFSKRSDTGGPVFWRVWFFILDVWFFQRPDIRGLLFSGTRVGLRVLSIEEVYSV